MSLACVVKDFEAEENAYAEEIKSLAERKRVTGNKKDRWKAYIAANMDPREKLSDARAALSWKESKAVDLEVEPEKLPAQFQRVKVEADKSAIKDALNKGETVEGARLVTRQNLQVK